MERELKAKIDFLVDELLVCIEDFKVSMPETNQYYALLLLITFYRENSYFETFLSDCELDELPENFNEFNMFTDERGKVDCVGEYLFDEVIATNNYIDYLGVFEIFESLDHKLLEKYFPQIFDNILDRITEFQSKSEGHFILPVEVAKFTSILVNLPKNAKVYNPFSGFASLGVYLNKDINYLGQELDELKCEIANYRMTAHQKDNVTIIAGDVVTDWNPKNEKYDLIIANPPFYQKDFIYNTKYSNSVIHYDHFLIENGLKALKDDGKLIAIIPNTFLISSGSEKLLRKFLVDNDLLEMLVSFPPGMLKSSQVAFSIIVINRRKEKKGIVTFIDASSFVENIGTRSPILNNESLEELIKSKNENQNIKIVENKTIEIFDYDLNIARYFLEAFDGEFLNSFCTKYKFERFNYSYGNGKLIQISNLKDEKFDFHLNLNDLENVEIPKNSKKISKSCLLIARVGQKLKPTYFEKVDQDIFINQNILALEIDTTKVDLSYLINELYADYVLKQINAIRLEATIPSISIHDLLFVKILLPNIQEQKYKVEGSKETFIQSKQKELELQRELLGLKEDTFREFASLKHTFRQYLNPLKSGVSGTRKFIAKNEEMQITLKSLYSKNLNQNFGEHLLSLEDTINSMSDLLMAFDEKTQGNREDLKELNLEKLIYEAQTRFKNSEIFNFDELYIDWESFSNDAFIIAPIVKILREDFLVMFSNIISNAVDHGFTKKNKKYRIGITLLLENTKEDLKYCVIEISNNGNPIPENFNLIHLKTRGEKTTDSKGSGTGGADIQEIVKRYNGKFELIKNEKSAFPVTYVIKLPLSTIIL